MEHLTSQRLITYVKSRREQGAGGTTINMDLGFIGSVLSHAKFEHNSIDVSMVKEARAYMKNVRMRTKSRKRDRRPTNDELTMLKDYFRNKKRQKIPMGDIMDFAVLTAMRLGEICSIAWTDVNYTDQTVIIRDRKDPIEKEGNDQVMPILDDAWGIMLAQPKTDKRIFPYQIGSVSSIFPRATKACKVVNLRFHDLRHEGTSQLFEMGYGIHEVAVFTGHKDWSMLKRYVHLRAKDLHFNKDGNRRVRRAIAPELLLPTAA
jgi:integrase